MTTFRKRNELPSFSCRPEVGRRLSCRMLRFIELKSEKSVGGSPEIQNAPLGSKRAAFCAGAAVNIPTTRRIITTTVNRLIISDLRVESGSPTLSDLLDRRRSPRGRRRIVPRRAPEPFLRCSRYLLHGRRA